MNATETQGAQARPMDAQRLDALVASIVEVTRQRDRIALEDCFGRAMLRLTGAKTLTVYHLEPKDDDTLVVPVLHLADGERIASRSANTKPFVLSGDAPLADKLRTPFAANSAQDTAHTSKEMILPLCGSKGEVCTFYRLENACNDANTRRMVTLLLEFYVNFLTLLDDNEHDALTGLLNRKTFDIRIANILNAGQSRHNRAADKSATRKFCLATLDIDHFKQVNDTFGHIYGDEVLLLFSNLMRKSFRDNDLLFRFGGEEFVVLLADTDIAQGHAALERFRCAVENYPFPQIGKLTVSIGTALLSAEAMPRTTIERADKALYFAKKNGRNQIRVYELLVEQGLLQEQNIQTGPIELF
jgi:diguanylate cyclase (GGDEF)-like protein